ncbi:MBOAT family protein [Barnesiella propionica]|uniref:MBOAT family O-acyltransferase n=1 Tax=Barnesiella propionica TaxID=2981781 RepID=UPI0011C8B746|nr:MBOAT family O-acyltransferase [Barnesiella propionica]MCU6768043.1 MBOAT family protein [Barnesiella propionica]
MLFNSFEFLIFFPLVFLFYWYILGKSRKGQNLFLLISSYIFYGWWDWTFLFLILFTSVCSYCAGLIIGNSENKKIRKLVTIANVFINLMILFVYKYYDFFILNFLQAFESIGIHLSLSTLKLVLPVGISFYTFQALGYTIDVYKRKVNPEKNVIIFLAFISFFPQLVAGPIERASNLLPQFRNSRRFNYGKAVDGMRQMLWGFFKKIVVADNCAIWANTIFSQSDTASASTLLLGAVYFTFQIYGDFSGYSDIAIGAARLFGINLMKNFNVPYFSRDIAEFWRRWHISLTTWFRDYVYIPLGGSRVSKIKVIRNVFIIFLLSGFWHGAEWTYILWGFYHACLFIPLLIWGTHRKHTRVVAENRICPSYKEMAQMLITFSFVMIGLVIFRSENIEQAFHYIKGMFNISIFSIPEFINKKALFAIFFMLVVEWFTRKADFALDYTHIKSSLNTPVIRWASYIIILLLILCLGGRQATFIYFQF